MDQCNVFVQKLAVLPEGKRIFGKRVRKVHDALLEAFKKSQEWQQLRNEPVHFLNLEHNTNKNN